MNSFSSIVAVSYLNTIPFIHGIQHSGFLPNADLIIEHPANCARLIKEQKTHFGLVPVGGLSQISGYEVFGDYCIGAIGKVYSVGLYSHVPLNEIREIYLDQESMTSVKLIKVLAEQFWKISPKWIPISTPGQKPLQPHEAMVLIGDKTFGLEKQFPFVFDLGEQWNLFTGLPFVFAVWVARKDVSSVQMEKLNQALQWGVEHTDEAIDTYQKPIDKAFAKEYLKQNISYPFDDPKKEGLKLFNRFISN